MSSFAFTVDAESTQTYARATTITTPHGTITTPVFMPVGTQGTVKSLSPEELRGAGTQILLGNTYHLMLRPGSELIHEFDGLHTFMQWHGPILTDSGGFQAFSLGHLCTFTEDGVTFRSHHDGSLHTLTPENVMRIEYELGADIVLPLDVCSGYPCSVEQAMFDMERTHRWAERSLIAKQEYADEQVLFGIVQGGFDPALRRQSARFIGSLPCPGVCIGGVSVWEPKALLKAMLAIVTPELPRDKPRHLLGCGSPEDFVMGVDMGMDMFDCVLPTRVARHGGVFTKDGRVNITTSRFRRSHAPIEEECDCTTCRTYSAAYLHHLSHVHEYLFYRLASIHNIRFMLRLAERMRSAILVNDFSAFRDDFLARYKSSPEERRTAQRERWQAARKLSFRNPGVV